MDAPERIQQLIAFLTANLPAPVDQQASHDEGLIFTAGEPPEVVVRLTPSMVIVAEYSGRWERPDTFVTTPRRVGSLKWQRLPETHLFNALEQLIKGARELRLARYAVCRYCSISRPPEWMHEDDVCVACAQRLQVH